MLSLFRIKGGSKVVDELVGEGNVYARLSGKVKRFRIYSTQRAAIATGCGHTADARPASSASTTAAVWQSLYSEDYGWYQHRTETTPDARIDFIGSAKH